MKLYITIFTILINWSYGIGQTRYHVEYGKVEFKSDANLELIQARTDRIGGILDIDKKVFAVSIPISSFKGFNSELQREHFNENYMESSKYPKGIYKGVITDSIDFRKNGYYTINTEGKLQLHGIETTRVFSCEIKVDDDVVSVNCSFEIALADHNIKIPKVVRHKLAENITVYIEANFVLKK